VKRDCGIGMELTHFLAPNAEYATETREELLYNKEKLLSNGKSTHCQFRPLREDLTMFR
jgi:hypothetical protein